MEEMLPLSPQFPLLQAGREFVVRMRNRIESGSSLIVESTLSGKSLLRHIDRASDRGYSTQAMFVFLDSADACVARVRHRVTRGGHNVPEEDIRRRYGRSVKNFWNYYRFAVDQWVLHSNSGEVCVVVACGNADNYDVFNDEAFELFLATAGGV